MKLSQDKLKNSQLHRNRDFRDHFLRFTDIRDQVFKKGTLGDLRDQVAALQVSESHSSQVRGLKLVSHLYVTCTYNAELSMFQHGLECILLTLLKFSSDSL